MTNEICFNDLSTNPLCKSQEDIDYRVSRYIQTLKAVGKQGIKKVRYSGKLMYVPLSDNCSVQDYCNMNMKDDNVRLIMSMATMPQVPDDDDAILEQYFGTTTFIHRDGEQINADGFNAAFCMDTYCIGFASEQFWNESRFIITVTNNGHQEEHVWYAVSSADHVENQEFLNWKEQFLPVVLCETQLKPLEKSIDLREDHGKDKLMEHARNLRNSPYVISIMTSLPFQDYTRSYINKNSDFVNGLIDITLFWEERGYSMRVKTTGRNVRETMKIAELLTKKYGRKH